jgi:hypothetical protein
MLSARPLWTAKESAINPPVMAAPARERRLA